MRRFASTLLLAVAALATTGLVGCADYAPIQETAVRMDYGTIQAIEVSGGAEHQPVNVGSVLGGVAGGVLGHQIGAGTGNTVATIAGALGGALLGNELDKRVEGARYRIIVRLDSGSTLVLDETRDMDLRVGDRVRVENNRVQRI